MSFQGPKVGPGPQPIRAHFVHMTPPPESAKIGQKNWAPLNQILDLPLPRYGQDVLPHHK